MPFNVGLDLTSLIPQSTNTNTNANSNVNVKGTQTSKKKIDQTAIDKIVADVLGSDQGLAALAQGENVSGASGSTVKTQLAQDLVTKLVGEIANITAETVTTTDQAQETQTQTQQSAKKKATVICTELTEQGMFPRWMYEHSKALEHFESLPQETVSGYHFWAIPVVRLMRKSPKLCKFLLPTVFARYEYILYGRRTFIGAATVHVGQPICYAIGCALKLFRKESNHGHAIS